MLIAAIIFSIIGLVCFLALGIFAFLSIDNSMIDEQKADRILIVLLCGIIVILNTCGFGIVVQVKKKDNAPLKIIRTLNQLGQEVPADYSGMKIIVYENGTTIIKNN